MLTLPALLAHPRVQLVAAADPRRDARARFAADIGGRTYENIEQLCADPHVEAVYVASPHELHAAQTVSAAHAGKHVLVEKPMATNLDDCRAMTAAAARAGVVLIVGPSHAFDAPVRLAARLIESGDFGAPRIITAFNYTDYVYRPRRPEELGATGGVLFGQAVHQIDVVRRLAGDAVVRALARTGDWDSARPTTGAYSAMLMFERGAAATLTYSGYGRYDSDELCEWISELGQPKDPEDYGRARARLAALTLEGEVDLKTARAYGASVGAPPQNSGPAFHEHFGFILVSCTGADLRITPRGVMVYTPSERRLHTAGEPAPRRETLDDFVSAILDGKPSLHDGAWGTDTVACCLALLESAQRGHEVSLEH